jgi:hypothetical protein
MVFWITPKEVLGSLVSALLCDVTEDILELELCESTAAVAVSQALNYIDDDF